MAGKGRPTLYREEYDEKAYKLTLLGAKDTELADFFEVSEVTLNAWKKAHPSFLKSLKAGKEDADANVGKRLYERAMGYEHREEKIFCSEGGIIRAETTKHYPPDTTAAIFWLKNRQPDKWRDRKEITGGDGKDLIPEVNSDLEAVRLNLLFWPRTL